MLIDNAAAVALAGEITGYGGVAYAQLNLIVQSTPVVAVAVVIVI
jgi:hypothetical protein